MARLNQNKISVVILNGQKTELVMNGKKKEKKRENLPFKSPVEELECKHWQNVQMEDGRDE